MENEIKKAIPVTIAQKEMKYFDVNLIKHDVLDMYPDSPAHDTPQQDGLPLHTSALRAQPTWLMSLPNTWHLPTTPTLRLPDPET